MDTIFWYDFETFGANPVWDRPSQFAGIRTDLELNIIGEPETFYCKQADDYLPHPQACLITGITPQQCQQEGYAEAEFIAKIHALFSEPRTCVAGYNSIRFDDEVTRNTLYRNFYDAYAREWQNGNSRWDILDMVRCAYALRPEGIEWPVGEDGKVSFRLELLTKANGIEHGKAHDAMSDVYATIALARLIKEKQPKLFQYLFELRRKENVAAQLDILNKKPVLHVSGMIPVERRCATLMVPLAPHPTNKNAVICFDLNQHPGALLSLPAEEIQRRLYTPKDQLGADERIALKAIHLNKCPVVAPAKMVTPDIAARIGLSGDLLREHLQLIKNGPDISATLAEVFSAPERTASQDPDGMLYSGGFFGPADKDAMEIIRSTPPEQLSELQLSFKDKRLEEMFFRYRARNYPEFLADDEFERWEAYRQQRLLQGNTPALTFNQFAAALQEAAATADPKYHHLLADLQLYAESIYPFS